MRLIDGDALKRKLQKVATEAWKMKLNASIEKTFNQCMDYIDSAPTIEPKQEWIPCSERLPEDLTIVLVWTEGEDIGIAFHMLDDGESDFAKISPAEGKVIAWMPMPGPWKGTDHKTESSEKPNNCETCRHKHDGTIGYCKTCGESNYEPKDEPQAECEITDCDYHDACKKRGQTDCQWK